MSLNSLRQHRHLRSIESLEQHRVFHANLALVAIEQAKERAIPDPGRIAHGRAMLHAANVKAYVRMAQHLDHVPVLPSSVDPETAQLALVAAREYLLDGGELAPAPGISNLADRLQGPESIHQTLDPVIGAFAVRAGELDLAA